MIEDDAGGDGHGAPEEGEGDGLQGGPVVAALAAGAVVEVHVVVAHQVQDHLRSLQQRARYIRKPEKGRKEAEDYENIHRYSTDRNELIIK